MSEEKLKPSPKCQALDINGKKCRKTARHKVQYHGDGEFYSNFNDNDVTWVQVPLCDKHYERVT